LTNLLITGLPRSGKTTLVKKLLEEDILKNQAGGFLTEELREESERIGFIIITIPEGRTDFLAKKGYFSPFRVGRYGVNIEALERLGCESITEALHAENIIVVDEIGKMELFSKRFRDVLLEALNSPQKVLATIMERPNPFSDRIKKRSDVKIFHLSRENFWHVFKEVKKWITIP